MSDPDVPSPLSLGNFVIDLCPGLLNGSPAYLFLTLINSLFAAQCSLQPPTLPEHRLQDNEEFDFIVVGAGTAGSVVANRLSENPDWKVLLIEAGGDPSVTTQIPGLSFNIGGTLEDWRFRSETQTTACLGNENQQCIFAAGKTFGGSTAINWMLYLRGNKYDYDYWEKLGNPGWNYENVLKYFKKSEDNLQFENKYHSTGGYLKVGYFRKDSTPLEDIITAASNDLKYKYIQDFNAANWIGYGKVQGTVFNGIRQSTATAFLEPVKTRSNLSFVKTAVVTKINIVGNVAKGVQITRNGGTIDVFAKNEVIISAGAINTPKLLMLSGIGPQNLLSEVNIPVVKNLPGVGQNLQDHMVFTGMFITLKENQEDWYQQTSPLDTIYEYFIKRKGDLAGVGLTDFHGFINTNPKSKYPNLQFEHIFFRKGQFDMDDSVLRFSGYNPNLIARIRYINRENSFFFPIIKYLHPKSRGQIKLRSSDPNDSPMVYPNYLTEEEDIDTYLKAIKFIRRLLATPSFQKYKPEILDIEIPECTSYKFLSDDYWMCNLKYLGISGYHLVGTAKMGPAADEGAVVDPRLRVHGIERLRVADASIMPKIPSGNTMTSTIMIGEKVPDMIKEDSGYISGARVRG